MAKKKYLRWRGMVTLFLLMALVVDAVSGVVLFLSPAGSIARWSNWSIWGLNKDQWESIHIVFSLVLLLILAGHVYFNWRMLTHFVWDKFRQVFNLKKEMAAAFAVTVLLVAGTLWNVQPVAGLLDARETMKRNGNESFVPGQGRGFSRNNLDSQQALPMPGGAEQNHFQSGSFDRQQPRGGGFGRMSSVQNSGSPMVHAQASQLRGRDYVQLGKRGTHTGILVRLGDEWGLKTEDTVFEIHLGPAEYRAAKGFALKEGADAVVSGFVYKSNLSVTTMESGGRVITLRDESGRPAWSGSSFGRGQERVFNINTVARQQPLGRGMGRRTYDHPQYPSVPVVHAQASQLRGRDYVRLGKLETHAGTLVRLGDEWGLKTDETVFEIHMGPSEYMASRGFALKAGEKAVVSGFVYQNNLSVSTMESGGQSITLRDETGRPAWSGSNFGRGAGRGGQGAFPQKNDS